MTTFICRNSDNTIQFDASNRIAKVTGSQEIAAGVSGTISTNIDTSINNIWYYIYMNADNMFRVPPKVSLSGNNISYSSGEASALIVWGAY